MVDRYILPIPKATNHRMYVKLKNKRMVGLMYLGGCCLLTFQFGRLNAMRIQGSKPAGYYIDWGGRDAPKKVRYFA